MRECQTSHNERGLDQANALATWAGSANLDAIYSSPLTGAITTAGPAAISAGLELAMDARLIEIDRDRARA